MYNCINHLSYKYSFPFFKSIAFQLDPELAHNLTIQSMKFLAPLVSDLKGDPRLSLSLLGMDFPSPLGLAAGLDKNAEALSFLTHLPFGFVEIGTVTPKAQVGNDKPRLFRYPEEASLRNKMGFNNQGAELVLENLKRSNRRGKVIGINLGKNKTTPNEDAPADYQVLYDTFADSADYLVINVSSPNTPGLRDLLKDKGLRNIFEALQVSRDKKPKPLFVKISPDMDNNELLSVVGLVNEYKLAGIIATNTTIIADRGEGGMSGAILYRKAKMVREILLNEIKASNSKAELIGVGGFACFEDLLEFWSAGGKLAQIYSSFIFQGPAFLFNIEKQLLKEMNSKGVKDFQEFLDFISKVR